MGREDRSPEDEALYRQARRRYALKRGLATHAFVFVVVNAEADRPQPADSAAGVVVCFPAVRLGHRPSRPRALGLARPRRGPRTRDRRRVPPAEGAEGQRLTPRRRARARSGSFQALRHLRAPHVVPDLQCTRMAAGWNSLPWYGLGGHVKFDVENSRALHGSSTALIALPSGRSMGPSVARARRGESQNSTCWSTATETGSSGSSKNAARYVAALEAGLLPGWRGSRWRLARLSASVRTLEKGGWSVTWPTHVPPGLVGGRVRRSRRVRSRRCSSVSASGAAEVTCESVRLC